MEDRIAVPAICAKLCSNIPAIRFAAGRCVVQADQGRRRRLVRCPGWPASAQGGIGVLADAYGRVATDLRVSLTDRCNLRCTYCMPAEGLAWLPKPTLLTDDEVASLVRVAVELLGVTEVRFTGGEPLLRPGIVGIVAAAAGLNPRPRLSVTTNGIGL